MPTLRWNPPKLTASTAVYEWGVPYAAANHNGAKLRNGGTITPRPWTEYAREEIIDLPDAFVDAFRSTDDLNQSFKITADKYNRAMKVSIRGKFWNWPNTTRRRNGTTVTSPRDIVDTSDLLNSQTMRFER